MSRRKPVQMRFAWEPNTVWDRLPGEVPCTALLSQLLEAVVETERKAEEANDERETEHPST